MNNTASFVINACFMAISAAKNKIGLAAAAVDLLKI